MDMSIFSKTFILFRTIMNKLSILIDPIVQLFGKTMGLSEGEFWKTKRELSMIFSAHIK